MPTGDSPMGDSSSPACTHEDFESEVEIHRIVDNAALDPEAADVSQFVADVRVRCADCKADFGFRGPPGGHSWREPRCAVDAKTVTLPLMSPAELALAGPLPAMQRGPMTYEVNP